jgi:hypothetical protein
MAMDLPAEDAETIAVSAFKPRSLELIERVASGRIARLVLTKRGAQWRCWCLCASPWSSFTALCASSWSPLRRWT